MSVTAPTTQPDIEQAIESFRRLAKVFAEAMRRIVEAIKQVFCALTAMGLLLVSPDEFRWTPGGEPWVP